MLINSYKTLCNKLSDDIVGHTFEIPERLQSDTGCAGKLLEELLGISENNHDGPDIAGWEIKYSNTKSASLLSLTRLHPTIEGGTMYDLMSRCGFKARDGNRTSLRASLWNGKFVKNFAFNDDGSRIRLSHPNLHPLEVYWTHDALMNAIPYKMRRMVVVRGTKTNRKTVRYDSATAYDDLKASLISQAILEGVMCIEFGAVLELSGKIRDRGTMFRIRTPNLQKLYGKTTVISHNEDLLCIQKNSKPIIVKPGSPLLNQESIGKQEDVYIT